jgi:prepilin-type N-terminal cleavage/methylation domain-containing protein
MSTRRNKAFTLTEMLVVISIIGVLVSMLLPAIQAAREAARRATCLANLRQSAHGIITYDARKGFLPAARTLYNYNPPLLENQNWVVPVLPMIERQDLSDTIRSNGGNPTSVMNETIPVLLCPDDPDIKNPGALSYKVNGGRADKPYTDASGVTYQRSDFLANGLFLGLSVPTAPPAWNLLGAVPSERKISLDRLRDGSSSTIMVAENLIMLSRSPPTANYQRWALANEVVGTPAEQDSQILWFPDIGGSDFIGLNQDDASGSVPADLRRFARPSSYHPGGFCIAFGDESSRFMSEAVDYRIYAVLLSSYGDKARDPSGAPPPSPPLPDPVWQSPNGVGYPGTKF